MQQKKTLFALIEMTISNDERAYPSFDLEEALKEMEIILSESKLYNLTFLKPFFLSKENPNIADIHYKNDDRSHFSALTKRQNEIVVFIQEGLSNKEIAKTLNISPATVKNHVHTILDKLHIDRRTKISKLGYHVGPAK